MSMTPKERLFARLAGKPVDQIPNLNIVMMFAANYAGHLYGEFCKDYETLVDGQLKTAEAFGIDILSTMSDPYRETWDFGAKVSYQEDYLPKLEEVFLKETEDFKEKLHLWDPMTSQRMLDRIRAIERFKQLRADTYAILGWVEGPWAEFTDLADISEAMMMLIDEPEAVCEALDLLTQQAIRCALAQLKAGADIIGMGDAAASLISRDMYRIYILPREKQIIEAVHRAGGLVKLHICGDVNHIIGDMVDSGADIVDIDYMVDWDRAIALSEGKCSICGNINPTAVILQGTPEENRKWVRYCAEHGNSRSIISSGCEIPRMTPPENLYAIADELRRIGNQGGYSEVI